MIFHNRFVRQDELVEFLSAADIYITPYLNAEQITSGTLAYAVGSGKAVISTPYQYARELLAEGRGVLVPARDPHAIACAAVDLLGDDAGRGAMCERARAFGRGMAWPAVARSYMDVFEQACSDALHPPPDALPGEDVGHAAGRSCPRPTSHISAAMTDDTGLLQHATFNVPRYADGYCLDDNARALLAMTYVEDAGATDDTPGIRALVPRYLAFVNAAYNPAQGRFRNFLTYSRRWTEERGSEDSHGRAVWALGAVVSRSSEPGRQSLCGSLFHSALPAIEHMSSPRAWSYALLGIDEYLRAFLGDSRVQQMRTTIARRLLELFERSSSAEWQWFEDRVTYCNARLPQALIVSGARMGDEEMVSAGLRSLEWLSSFNCRRRATSAR